MAYFAQRKRLAGRERFFVHLPWNDLVKSLSKGWRAVTNSRDSQFDQGVLCTFCTRIAAQ